MTEQVRDAMIVAGGAGTRLQPLTLTRPKPLLPFCGEPFLAGVVRRLAGAGVQHVFLVVGADTAPFERLRPVTNALGLDLTIVPEPEPLDTAGGVRAALDGVAGTFLVCNGDILTDIDLPALVAAHRDAGAEATLALTRVDDTSSYGVCVREGTRIVAFVEKPDPGSLPGQDAVNAGTYVLEPHVLADHAPGPLSFERQVFPDALRAGRHLEGFVWEGVWADLGTPERFLEGHRLALSGALSWPSLARLSQREAGVWVADDVVVAPGAAVVAPSVLLEGSRIEAGAVVGPHALVGRRVRIARDVALRDSVLFDGAAIEAGATLETAIVGGNARVGAGSRLTATAVVGDDERLPPATVLTDGQRIPAPRS